jgi:hypothetical protein
MNGLLTGSDLAVAEPEQTQLSIALQRIKDEALPIDPQSCVARFGSAF